MPTIQLALRPNKGRTLLATSVRTQGVELWDMGAKLAVNREHLKQQPASRSSANLQPP